LVVFGSRVAGHAPVGKLPPKLRTTDLPVNANHNLRIIESDAQEGGQAEEHAGDEVFDRRESLKPLADFQR
jgi:hypothetical protein